MDNNISLKIARTDEEIKDFQRFLFDIYCLELRWHDQSKFHDGIFADEHDSKSTFLLVYSKKEIIAGLRLVKDSESGFPHENEISTKLPILNKEVDLHIREKISRIGRDRIREITRLVGKQTIKRVLAVDLMKCLYWYGVYNRIDAYFMVVDMSLFLLCHKLHVPLAPVEIPKYCEGSWTIPAVMIPYDVQVSLKEKNPEAWRYISDKSNLVGEWKE